MSPRRRVRLIAVLALLVVPATLFADDNPFGRSPFDDPPAPTEQELRVMGGRRQVAVRRAAANMAESDVPAERLLGSLSVLVEGRRSLVDAALDRLVRDIDRRDPDAGTMGEWVSAAEAELETLETTNAAELREARALRANVLGGEAEWPWTSERKQWVTFLEAIERGFRERWPEAVVRERIAADLVRANLYREAYLAIVRVRRLDEIDFAIADDYVTEENLRVGEQFERLSLVVASLLESRVPFRERPLQRWEDSLVEVLGHEEVDADDVNGARWSLSRLTRERDDEPEARSLHRRELERRLCKRAFREQAPGLAGGFARMLGLDEDTVRTSFLAKSITVRGSRIPLGDVVRTLAEAVALPLWIEPGVLDDETPIDVDESGRWWDVARRALAKADHVAVFVDEAVIWIGPRAGEDAAVARIRQVIARSTALRGNVMAEPSATFFEETPADECLQFLGDLHDVPIIDLAESREPIDLMTEFVPLYAVLDQVCERADLTWIPFENVLVVVRKGEFAKVRKALDVHRDRLVALRALELDGERSSPPSETTEVQFVDIPLSEGMEFLNFLHETRIEGLSPELEDKPLNLIVDDIGLTTGLTLLTLKHDFAWYSDGIVTVYGTAEDVAAYAGLVKTRGERRKERGAMDALRQAVTLDESRSPSRDVLQRLGEWGDRRIRTDPKLALPETLTVALDEVPFDVVLDVLAVRLDAKWSLEGDDVVFSPR